MMHILLVEPNYYTRYPSLGLLKISTYHKNKGDTVEYIRGEQIPNKKPDLVYVTSLFTWAWKPVHNATRFYKTKFPDARVLLGGIYASLLPNHARLSDADEIVTGIFEEAEDLMPDYDLIPEYNASILFTSRGCIRKCGFCAVPILEGKPNGEKHSIKHLIHPNHKKVILWDNNFIANRNKYEILDELLELKLEVDFNQGLDARLITDKFAERLAKLRTRLIRIAYDTSSYRAHVERAIEKLFTAGVNKRKITVYTLYNYEDTPDDFLSRVRDLLNWGVVSYPMRYEPLASLRKNSFIGINWEKEQLDMIARARRVIGFFGSFPPYIGLIDKINKASDFNEAFTLCPPRPKSELNEIYQTKLNDSSVVNKAKENPKWGGSLDWRTHLLADKNHSIKNQISKIKGVLNEKTK